MFGWEIGFDSPLWLLLLFLIPVLWIWSFKGLSGLGPYRRVFALVLRSFVFALFVFALSDFQLKRVSEKLTVIYLLDQSQSIPETSRQLMWNYVVEEVATHRNDSREDAAGVLVFGAEAKIAIAPVADIIYSLDDYIEIDTHSTNLAGALRQVLSTFPEDTAKRVVIVTDGNENIGDARTAAKALADKGVGIDVVPIDLIARAEIAVSKVTLPADIRKGQTVETRVVVESFAQPTEAHPDGKVAGKLRLIRTVGRLEQMIGEQDVELEPGKNVYGFKHEIDQVGVFTYKATFVPKDPLQDLMQENNEATAFTHVRGQGRVLLIHNANEGGQFLFLADQLREMKLEVTDMSSDDLFTTPAELLGYDSIILANTPRTSDDGATSFSDAQIEMLVSNTEQFGCGLVMIGGEESFGAGGWSNTKLEEAMPVDFQIKNAKVEAVGALVLMMHASEMAQGNFWQKVTAKEAIKALGPMDYCGLIHWQDFAGSDAWLWGTKGNGLIRVTGQRGGMLARLDRMAPGDMPDFNPAMKQSLAAFNTVKASVKHMIIISDGDPTPPSNAIINGYKAAGIKISTVAVGTHGPAGSTPLQKISAATGGKYYVVKNPKALPRIYQREARRVARPLIYEPTGGVGVDLVYRGQMLSGIDDDLDPIRGYMLTTVKENPLVEVHIRANKPADDLNNTILASWTYGLGKTIAFTSDAGHKWTDQWTNKPYYKKLFSQIVQHSLRPISDSGKFTVATDTRDGKVRLIINALNQDDEFFNFLQMQGSGVNPDIEPFPIDIRQEAPGRYVGEFPADKPGSYFLTVNTGSGGAPLLAGVDVPFSSEFTDRETNTALLKSLATSKPVGGEPGEVVEGSLSREGFDQLLKFDTFRHNLPKAISSQQFWPWLMVIAAIAFFADVFVRRVQVDLFEMFAPIGAWINRNIFGRGTDEQPDETMARLRSRKAAVSEQLDQRRAANRFEPTADDQPARDLDDVISEASAERSSSAARPTAADTPEPSADTEEDNSLAARLMRAKKDAHKKKD